MKPSPWVTPSKLGTSLVRTWGKCTDSMLKLEEVPWRSPPSECREMVQTLACYWRQEEERYPCFGAHAGTRELDPSADAKAAGTAD
jgi:hypothetical protein